MATYYIEAAGADTNAGTSQGAGNAWLTIDKAMNTVAAGDTVYVKNDQTYAEVATIDTGGTNTAPIRFVGYTSTITDGGVATITGSAARTNCIADSLAVVRVYYVFENFRFTNATAAGVLLSVQATFWKNCQFDTNATIGIQAGSAFFENCKFNDNTTRGAMMDSLSAVFIGCRFYANGTDGLAHTSGLNGVCVCAFCTFYSNGSVSILAGQGNDSPIVLINCTIDGDAKDSTDGLKLGGFRQLPVVVNSVFYDCVTGINSTNDQLSAIISRNNLVNGNTTAYTNFQTWTDEVTSAPSFNAESSQDYRPSSSSPLLSAGFDENVLEGYSKAIDIGALQNAAIVTDYPAVGDVELGVVYNSGGSTGTFAKPAVGEVKTGVGYGAGGTEFTGTRTHPAVGEVKTGVTYGSGGTEFTGTRTVPAVGEVKTGVQYGAAGTEFTGTRTVPAVGDVESPNTYGAGGTEFTGTFTEPGVGNVKLGTTYGAGGTEFTGTLPTGSGGNTIKSGGAM